MKVTKVTKVRIVDDNKSNQKTATLNRNKIMFNL